MIQKLPTRLKEILSCRICIVYGNDMADKRCLETLNHIISICDRFKVKYIVKSEKRYCCSDYRYIKVSGFLSLKETADLIQDLELDIDVYYSIEKGIFSAEYNNTIY